MSLAQSAIDWITQEKAEPTQEPTLTRVLLQALAMSSLSDGERTAQEERVGRIFAASIPALTGIPNEIMSELLAEAFSFVSSMSEAAWLSSISVVLKSDRERAQVLAMACAVVNADREVNEREAAFLARLQSALGLSSEDARLIMKGVLESLQRRGAFSPPKADDWQSRLFRGQEALSRGDYEDATRELEAALAFRQAEVGYEDKSLLDVMRPLSTAYQCRKQRHQQLMLLRKQMMLEAKIYGEDSSEISRTFIALSRILLEANIKVSNSAPPLALQLGIKAFSIRVKSAGKDHVETAEAALLLARLFQRSNRHQEALTVCRHAAAIYLKERKDSEELAESIETLASLYESLGEHESAVAMRTELTSLRERQLAALKAQSPKAPANQTEEEINLQAIYQDKLAALEEQGEDSSEAADEPLEVLAGLHLSQERYAEAETMLLRLITNKRKRLGEGHLDLSPSLERLCHVLMVQDKWRELLPPARELVSLREAQHQKKNTPEALLSLQQSMLLLAGGLLRTGELSEAALLLERLLQHLEGSASEEGRITCYQLAANVYTQLGDPEKAYQHSARLFASMERLVPMEAVQGLFLLARAIAQRRRGRPEDALSDYKRAARMIEEAGILLEPSIAFLEKRLGLAHEGEQRIQAFLVAHRKAHLPPGKEENVVNARKLLAYRENQLGPEHPLIPWSLYELGTQLMSAEKFLEAYQHFERAALLREKRNPLDPELGVVLETQAQLLYQLGQIQRAQEVEAKALSIPLWAPTPLVLSVPNHPSAEQTLSAAQRDTWEALFGKGNAALRQGDFANAESFLLKTVEDGKLLKAPVPRLALAINQLARVRQNQKRYEEAEALFREAISMAELSLGATHPDVGIYLMNLAHLLQQRMNRLGEAEPMLRSAGEILSTGNEQERSFAATVYQNLARTQSGLDKLPEAEVSFKKALSLLGGLQKPDLMQLSNIYDELGALYCRLSKLEEAAQSFEHCLSLRSERFGAYAPELVLYLTALVGLYLQTKKLPEAAQRAQQMLEIAAREPKLSESLQQGLSLIPIALTPRLWLSGIRDPALSLLSQCASLFARKLEPLWGLVQTQWVALLLDSGAEAKEEREKLAAFWKEDLDSQMLLPSLEAELLKQLRTDRTREEVEHWESIIDAANKSTGRPQGGSIRHPELILSDKLLELGELMQSVGDQSSARNVLQQALTLREKHLPPDAEEVSVIRKALAKAMRAVGDEKAASSLEASTKKSLKN